MRIGAFIYGLTWGGATRRLLTLLEAFAEKGHQVELVVVDAAGPMKTEMSSRIRLVPLEAGIFAPIWPLISRRAKMSLARFSLAGYFRKAKIDLFLSAANHAHITALSAWRISGVKTPFVLRLSSHVTASLKKSRKIRKRVRFLQAKRLYPLADKIVAVSRAVAADAMEALRIPRDKVKVVYNPVVTTKLLEMAKQRPSHPWLQDEPEGRKIPVLLAAGRLRKQKGFSTIIRAVGLASAKRSMRLIILGEGKYRRRLEALVNELGLREAVDMPGFVSNPVSYMARADLFCHASTFEGLPGVIIEALAAGCPVVCTDSPGGASEILEGGRYGLLVHKGDEKAFAEALIKGLEMDWDSEKLKRRAMDFSLDAAVKGYLDTFKELAGRQNV